MKRNIFISVTISSLCFLLGCGKEINPYQKLLVGKWYHVSTDEKEYSSDTLYRTYQSVIRPPADFYEFKADGRANLYLSGVLYDNPYRIEGDTLIINNGGMKAKINLLTSDALSFTFKWEFNARRYSVYTFGFEK